MKLIKNKGKLNAVKGKIQVYKLDTAYHNVEPERGSTYVEYILKEDMERYCNEAWILIFKDFIKSLKKAKKIK